MNRLRYHELLEADHDIQNPMSAEKLRRMVDYLNIEDGDRIVDVGSGKGWLMCELAATRRVHITGLEFSRVFADAAARRLASTRLIGSAEIVFGPALEHAIPAQPYDIALCIGATMALGDIEGALDWMSAAVRPGGRIAIGEPFVRKPMPRLMQARRQEYTRSLADLGEAFRVSGLDLTGIVASSEDDWDHYECQHWRAAANFLAAHPDDPDAAEVRTKSDADRASYLAEEREGFGWAIFVARKTA